MRNQIRKRHIAPIIEGNLKLRLLDINDLDKTLGWRNQDAIRKWFIHSDLITDEQHQKWFEEYSKRENDFVFIIEEIRNLNMPIGQISLYDIDWKRKHAEFGRLMIGEPDAKRLGFAKAATRMVLEFGFTFMKLSSIELEVIEGNMPAIAIYQKLGFRVVSQYNYLKKMVCRSDWIPFPQEESIHDVNRRTTWLIGGHRWDQSIPGIE